MRDYKLFYPTTDYKGKWHTADKITGVADCHNQLVDLGADPIHLPPNQEKIHPLLCKKCVKIDPYKNERTCA